MTYRIAFLMVLFTIVFCESASCFPNWLTPRQSAEFTELRGNFFEARRDKDREKNQVSLHKMLPFAQKSYACCDAIARYHLLEEENLVSKRLYAEALKIFPARKSDIYLQLAKVYQKEKNYTESLKNLNLALLNLPKGCHYADHLPKRNPGTGREEFPNLGPDGEVAEWPGANFQNAWRAIKATGEPKKLKSKILSERAFIYGELGKHSEAISDIRKLLKLDQQKRYFMELAWNVRQLNYKGFYNSKKGQELCDDLLFFEVADRKGIIIAKALNLATLKQFDAANRLIESILLVNPTDKEALKAKHKISKFENKVRHKNPAN